ncbi:hypothetical protein UFOVP257_182 [uncultured Caudovirales phage]|uniref:Protein kinase domain-containing protein n=1 Tax=uncultured Caudovirales phage TaxID=2100421 RepID=A0A6J5LK16_9CAUD|nr:hypothetical protein UFOVP257_182 [uncultured Caudovirales phage]
MRINEIVDTEFMDVERKRPYDSIELFKQEKRAARRMGAAAHGGSGWYSRGYQNPRDPHEFVKTTHKPSILYNDAYFHYVSTISNLQRKNYRNPYFPVVYQVKISMDSHGNERPRYRMETLQDPKQYPIEAIMGMMENMFIDPSTVFGDMEITEKNKGQIWIELAHRLDYCILNVNSTSMRNIKDRNLKAALVIIHNILKKYDIFEPDIHGNNIMVRGTPYGPQLVLMDPISDNGESIPSDDVIDNEDL